MATNPAAAADLARSMAEALAATGASADEIAATMQEALNASLNNADADHLDELLDVADTIAKSMADAGASPEEIANAMKNAFAAAGTGIFIFLSTRVGAHVKVETSRINPRYMYSISLIYLLYYKPIILMQTL